MYPVKMSVCAWVCVCVSSGSVQSAVRFAQKQRTISAKLSIAAACKLSEPNVKYENAKQASTQQQQQHSDQAHLFDTKTITKKKRKRKKVAKEKSKRLHCVCGCVCVFCQTAILRSICHNTLKFSLNSSASALAHWVPSGRREGERAQELCLLGTRALSISWCSHTF